MQYIQRDSEAIATNMSSTFPSLLVVGARQVGKSTLLRQLFSGCEELNLDLPLERARITQDTSLLQPRDRTILLEEVQKLPEIFEVLKAYIDRDPPENRVEQCRAFCSSYGRPMYPERAALRIFRLFPGHHDLRASRLETG